MSDSANVPLQRTLLNGKWNFINRLVYLTTPSVAQTTWHRMLKMINNGNQVGKKNIKVDFRYVFWETDGLMG